ncbi:MAG: sodium:proton antiporter [Pseudomonadota bacterium]|nr:sodium:proton antiporter [Pseudomonadota bacterium]
MTLFQAIGAILTLVALFGYLNARFFRLPEPVGITAVGLAVSLVVAIAGLAIPAVARGAQLAVDQLNFSEVVFQGMLGLLLFAASLHIDWSDMAQEKWAIGALASIGVLASTALVGTAFYYVLQWTGFALPFLHCLLFGALISPTDPIAVMSMLRSVGLPKRVETRIAGESLFNDGTGVVVFLTLLGLATGGSETTITSAFALLALQVVGGAAIGFAGGFVGFYMLRGIDSYAVEILITLAMATAGYALAEVLHGSAPIAVVIMGLVIGNHGRVLAMSERTRQRLFEFWEVVDEILNLVLFGLIGLNVIALVPALSRIAPALYAIPIVLIARWISVGVPLLSMHRLLHASRNEISIMTWGGLRGGISVALALSLSHIEGRNVIIAATYAVVLFSILVQALTLVPMVRWLESRQDKRKAAPRREPARG